MELIIAAEEKHEQLLEDAKSDVWKLLSANDLYPFFIVNNVYGDVGICRVHLT